MLKGKTLKRGASVILCGAMLFNPVLLNNISSSFVTANAEVSEENELVTKIFKFNFFNVDDYLSLNPEREFKVRISCWIDKNEKLDLGVYHFTPDSYSTTTVAGVPIPPEYESKQFEITAVDFPEGFMLATMSAEPATSIPYLLSEPFGITISKEGRFNTTNQYVGNMYVSQPEKYIYKIGEELDLSGAKVRGNGVMMVLGNPVAAWDEFGSDLADGKYSVDASDFDNTKPGCYFIKVNTSFNVDRFGFFVYVVEDEEDMNNIIYNQGELQVSGGKNKYIHCGENLDLKDIEVSISSQYCRNEQKIKGTSLSERLWSSEDYSIDTSAVDINTPGSYEVKINYTPNDEKTYDGCKVVNAILPAIINVTVIGEGTEEADISEEVEENEGTDVPENTDASEKIKVTIYGDANCDDEVSLADTVTIMQTLANPDKYKMSAQGLANADVSSNGDGITGLDALAIQKYKLELVPQLPESYK